VRISASLVGAGRGNGTTAKPRNRNTSLSQGRVMHTHTYIYIYTYIYKVVLIWNLLSVSANIMEAKICQKKKDQNYYERNNDGKLKYEILNTKIKVTIMT